MFCIIVVASEIPMSREKTGKMLFVIICSLFPAVICDSQQPPTSVVEKSPVVITSGRHHGQYYLEVEPNPLGEKDSLHLLSLLCEEKGHDYPVLSLVDDTAKISDLYNPVSLAGKAQCNNIRTFALHLETGSGYMYEIKLSKGVPISKRPAPYSETK
jgi:hypothetical protein